jgi:MFS transporter, putative metabolite transport protein
LLTAIKGDDAVQTQQALSPARAHFVRHWTSRLVAFGEFIDGYDLLVMGAALLFLRPDFSLSAGETGALTATAFVGTAVGLVVFGDLSDRVGRRLIFTFNLALFVVASVASAFVTDVWQLFVARFVIGIAVGMDIPASHAFLAEVAPSARRGRIAGSLPNMMWLSGAIVSVVLALAIAPVAGDSTWRWLFGLAAIPAAGVLVMRQFLPESPRWLIMHGREDEGRGILRSLGLDDAVAVASEGAGAGAGAGAAAKRSWAVLFRGQGLRRLLAVSGFFALQSFAGAVSTVAGPLVLESTGLSTVNSLWFSGAGFVIGLVAVVVGAQIIDRVDRRMLGIWTCSALFVAAIGMATLGARSAIALVVLYVVFSLLTWLGPGVLSWVWASEAFPTEVRSLGSGIAQCLARIAIAVNVALVPTLLATIGLWTIAVYAIAYLVCLAIVISSRWLSTTGAELEETSSVPTA